MKEHSNHAERAAYTDSDVLLMLKEFTYEEKVNIISSLQAALQARQLLPAVPPAGTASVNS